MKEIIESIEAFGENPQAYVKSALWQNPEYEGYLITTNLHRYVFAIAGGQWCCEIVGKFSTEDNLEDFIGSELYSIEFIENGCFTEKKLEKIGAKILENLDDIAFVNVITSKGTFQLAVYNSNGEFYGHGVVFIKDNEKTESTC